DPARPALLEEHLPGLQVNAVEHVGPYRAKRFHQPAGIDEAHALRHREALYRRHRRVFAVPVGDQEGADLVAELEPAGALAELDDRAGAFEPGDVAGPRRHRIAPHAL